MSNSASLINFKDTLKVNSSVTEIKAIVREKLTKVDLSKLDVKVDTSLINFICRLVWSCTKELGLKLDDEENKTIVFEIYTTFLTLTQSEILILKNQVDYFIKNKQIKPVTIKKWLLDKAVKFLKNII
jgi:hypothetical protein